MYELTSTVVAVAVIYLLFANHRIGGQLAELQRKINELSDGGLKDADQTVAVKAEEAPPVDPVTSTATTGPWADAKGQKIAPTVGKSTKRTRKARPKKAASPFVFRAENLNQAGKWLVQNWFLAIAALSLALAAVFLVQYGVENGLLSPFWRVMAAVALGVALIIGGEVVRRKWGDHATDHTAYLPSTFAGAGLVALFAAVLSARGLYGMIGPEAAMAYLVLVSAVAVFLGWFYGPYLAVVGILGSVAAPFLVGGDSSAPEMFYYYFALIAVVALLVDALRRWAWVSALGLIFTYAAAWFIFDLGAAGEHFLAFGVISAVAAIALPRLSVWPSHTGEMVSAGLLARLGILENEDEAASDVEFPTRVAAGAFAAAGAIAVLVAWDASGSAEIWLAISVLCFLYLIAAVWCRGAAALADLALLPPVLLLAVVTLEAIEWGALYQEFEAGLNREPETSPPMIVSVLAAISLVGSAIAHWRGLWPGRTDRVWSGGAALFAPLMLVTLEFWWNPVPVLGAGYWAAHGIVIAALMVLFAGQVARRDGEDKCRVAYFALAALTMISFALVIVLSSAALTVSLAVMVLVAALIDRRLNLPLMGIFIQIGVVVIGWRLVLDPGLFWADDAPLWEVILAYLGSAGLMSASWIVLAQRARTTARLTVESGIWATLGVFASVMLNRALGSDFESHWGLSLFGSVWLILMMVQIYRLQAGGWMRWVRIGLAGIYGLLALFIFALAAAFANPLISSFDLVVGPPIFDSLLVALGVPALIFAIGAWKLPDLHHWLRIGFIALAAAFMGLYLTLEIRRLWRGPDLSVPGTSDAELYSYTIALLLVSVALLFFAFSRRSLPLRQIATIGIGLTIAKVFLVDMAGLAGLLRVASFLGLGLSLAGLGWIYRRMADQWDSNEAAN